MKKFEVLTHNGFEFVIEVINEGASNSIHSRLKEKIYKKLDKKYPNHSRVGLLKLGDSLEIREI